MSGSPAPAITTLLQRINDAFPERSKVSDGIMGDAAHQARQSDHNDGNALDVTHDPEHGPDLEAMAEALIRDPRTHYVIWRSRIRNVAFEDGAWRPYNGASPHDHHLHVSVHAEQRDDTSPWDISPIAAAEPEELAAGDGVGDPHPGAVVVLLVLLFGVAWARQAYGRAAQPRVCSPGATTCAGRR